jgi:hypothetical protein
MSTEAHQVGGSDQDPSEKTMAPRMFDVKFSYGTQLTFRSLTFAAGEDRDLKMLLPGLEPEHLALASSSVTIPQVFTRARGPLAASAHEVDTAQVRVLIGCVFVEIVIESETCHIYRAVLLTI